ncbi:hypothetical protein DPMN_173377 [Dreissena polymorpha]|uniref:Uncharacterized protein n=1 Tax=Dreissena polymorpha TaxID=45954 RepID=A0A9D4E3Z8_DREPO|nr:hypothetical protein DPMN_173377 [Dreissena polymorpha]
MIVGFINGCCEQQEWFFSRTENPSQPNGSHGIDLRIELVQHGHSYADATFHNRVNTTSNVSSSQYFTGCGCRVNPVRLSNTVEQIDDGQEG